MAKSEIAHLLVFVGLFLSYVSSEIQFETCNKNLKRDRYVSRNNVNSSCGCDESRKAPRIITWSNKKRKCSFMNIDNDDVVVFTVATNDTDGFRRYVRSARVNGFDDKLKVLGFGEVWKGGNVRKYAGGGHKVNLFKKALEEYKDDTEKIIIFTDSYDLVFLSDLDTILEKFKEFDSRILFSAESNCWPDKSLASKYPSVARGKRFLNSGGIIGFATDLYSILSYREIEDSDDDQLFFTHIYLDPELREKHKIKLDHKSEIFQNLYGAVADVELRFKGNDAYLQNTAYNTVPLVVHGNGISKIVLNYLGNYLAQAWSPEEGCLNCWDDAIELPKNKPENYPVILIAIFIEKPMPFLEEFFEKIYTQTYPKSKLHLFIHNHVPYHKDVIDNFIEKHGDEYKSVKKILPDDRIDEVAARNLAMDHCLLKKCSGYFSIDAEAHLDNEHTLRLLVEQQRGIVAPLLIRPFKAWSNFWGAVTDDGFYARSSDYMQIIHNERRGLWNVPFISSCYLINSTIIRNKETRPSYSEGDLDPDMAFASANRERLIFMYVSNRLEFGHLVIPDSFDTSLTNPDLYQIFDNKLDWEKRYIHENYSKNFEEGQVPIQPCPDVYWFPIINTRMTKEMIEIMENFGQWSDGSNKDSRLRDGYENVPTRDIHMNQVNFERQWLYLLKEYVRPLQELVFLGYYHDPPRSLMNFVVRYRPDEQPSLRPHHDSSTYTINIALNKAGVDYEGGGCRFIRYDCAVTDTKPGWMLMHPGRLTHYHEGLIVTKGTRYIMISFVDP
ncbi:procollagen-lysine,2-oxoglutarate 5-dioxygenase isoform X1 [Belonocnema kinseyi]|uniref:procollagen-lysine,2-oxoglutarate 5-dioxygenase isoform X1 n=1 Tax=Belonocnema kinseyi TaxID=2817044 RepID=UPI00143D8683|nr:procollagen-lysine,2-oxoglutarate 5-dioxygenase isoform X1 [Belonocnema kinseyi]XP_033224284.1 procollagen-lysine,2-oxoglutarate 5-dioxygenase isoform X1 [Belonocnema kinseyi]